MESLLSVIEQNNKEESLMEWIDLDTDNLPTGYFEDNSYLFEWRRKGVNDNEWSSYYPFKKGTNMELKGKLAIITHIVEDSYIYRYSKAEPKLPTHQEIMTRWWCLGKGDAWYKVITYRSGKRNLCYGIVLEVGLLFYNKEWFIGRESSDMPPEAK